MIYGSVCSGIECASVAWEPLGWSPAFFAETERFPSAVLAHHWPDVPNLGDFTKIGSDHAIDLLVGGTPCQSFSGAGKRAGLDDPRGNLTLEFFALARRLRPTWIVWENVPGVLSHDDGRTFGTILGILGQLGYGWSYRCLDAQYVRVDGFGRAVPQRRRRVILVGYLDPWTYPAAVLFDRESLSGNPPPRRTAGEDVASTLGIGPPGSGWRDDTDRMTFVAECGPPLTGNPYGDHESREGLLVAHALTGEGFDASEDGTGRGTPLVPVPVMASGCGNAHPAGIGRPGDPAFALDTTGAHAVAFSCKDHGADVGEIAPTLRAMGHDGSHANADGQVAVAFAENSRAELRLEGGDGAIASLKTGGGKPGQSYPAIVADWRVRRLLPVECERLMGLPDDYTRIPWRGKPAELCPDGPRYRAIGNGMAVNVMRWIGQRIETVDAIARERAA